MPFLLLAKPLGRLQSRTEMSPRQPTGNENARQSGRQRGHLARWPEDIFSILERFDVRQVPYVPDAGHLQLIDRVIAEPSMQAVSLTTEEIQTRRPPLSAGDTWNCPKCKTTNAMRRSPALVNARHYRV